MNEQFPNGCLDVPEDIFRLIQRIHSNCEKFEARSNPNFYNLNRLIQALPFFKNLPETLEIIGKEIFYSNRFINRYHWKDRPTLSGFIAVIEYVPSLRKEAIDDVKRAGGIQGCFDLEKVFRFIEDEQEQQRQWGFYISNFKANYSSFKWLLRKGTPELQKLVWEQLSTLELKKDILIEISKDSKIDESFRKQAWAKVFKPNLKIEKIQELFFKCFDFEIIQETFIFKSLWPIIKEKADKVFLFGILYKYLFYASEEFIQEVVDLIPKEQLDTEELVFLSILAPNPNEAAEYLIKILEQPKNDLELKSDKSVLDMPVFEILANEKISQKIRCKATSLILNTKFDYSKGHESFQEYYILGELLKSCPKQFIPKVEKRIRENATRVQQRNLEEYLEYKKTRKGGCDGENLYQENVTGY